MAINYSDTEQDVGTFFDDTLYQKTIIIDDIATDLPNADITMVNDFSHGISSINNVVIMCLVY